MKAADDSLAIVAFSLPSELFPEGDESCATAGSYIARELGQLLSTHGHSIPAWAEGGCREDGWVHLESERAGIVYGYDILFFPRPEDTQSMAIRYGPRAGFWQRLFRGDPPLMSDDPLREVMKHFASRFTRPEVLTGDEFDAQY